jgi:hypothetical protein
MAKTLGDLHPAYIRKYTIATLMVLTLATYDVPMLGKEPVEPLSSAVRGISKR